MQPKDRVSHILDIIQCTLDSRSYHGTGVVDVDTLANTIRATSPPRVNQVAAHIMLLDALTKQVCIFTWAQGQESGSETRAKGGLWCGHSSLGTGQFTGIARQEVIHGLRCGQL